MPVNHVGRESSVGGVKLAVHAVFAEERHQLGKIFRIVAVAAVFVFDAGSDNGPAVACEIGHEHGAKHLIVIGHVLHIPRIVRADAHLFGE